MIKRHPGIIVIAKQRRTLLKQETATEFAEWDVDEASFYCCGPVRATRQLAEADASALAAALEQRKTAERMLKRCR